MSDQSPTLAEPLQAPPSPQTAPPPPARPKPPASRGRRRAFTIFFLLLTVAAVAGILWWLHARQYESTDDAQVDAHLNPISSRVDGTITKVYVDDNQIVKPGDPLVDLDPRDFQVTVDQQLAQLAQARHSVVAEQPNVPITQVENITNISAGQAEVDNAKAALAAAQQDRAVAAARVTEAQANNARAQADLARYQKLIAQDEVSRQDYDQALAAAKAQAATVQANQASLKSASQTVDQRRAQLAQAQSRLAQYQRNAPHMVAIRQATVASSQASVQNAEAQLEEAKLKLSYTKITAPVAGIVMKRTAEVGAHVTAGQQLFQLAQVDDQWVTANFKETQLKKIRINQPATIHVDALNRDFEGYVESIGGSTGAVASVLPPENATGNYVKVVQRIPVRIRFKQGQADLDRLRPGMSVEPEVHVGG